MGPPLKDGFWFLDIVMDYTEFTWSFPTNHPTFFLPPYRLRTHLFFTHEGADAGDRPPLSSELAYVIFVPSFGPQEPDSCPPLLPLKRVALFKGGPPQFSACSNRDSPRGFFFFLLGPSTDSFMTFFSGQRFCFYVKNLRLGSDFTGFFT